ncbi:MAG TPA: glycogen debranching N-terminal domain-containing protein, partial [Pseudorhodoplanes sp.]|nr:glycogen debranching N-terminal domain-containing protein [Pseudorhodoplanes sp.]
MPIATPLTTSLADTLRVDPVVEAPFYIPITGSATRPRRVLKYGDTFLVVDSHGDIGAAAGGPDGLFHNDTRFLSRMELHINGVQPLLLGSNVRDDNTLLSIDLTNPDIYSGEHIVLLKDTLHIVRTIFLWRGAAYQRLKITNHGDCRVKLRLSFSFGSDFADLFEVRGLRRKRRGAMACGPIGPDYVSLNYRGLHDQPHRTTLTFDPHPTRLEENDAHYDLDVPPGEGTPIFLSVACDQPPDQKPVTFTRGLLAAHRELRRAAQGMTT